MTDLAQLTAWRDALMAARYRSVRTVEYGGKRVTYATDGEMAAALADLDRKIVASGGCRVSVVRIASSNGDVITVTAPTGGVTSGDGVIVGSLLGIAAFPAAEGEAVEIATTGVYMLPKEPTAVIAAG